MNTKNTKVKYNKVARYKQNTLCSVRSQSISYGAVTPMFSIIIIMSKAL